MAERAVINASPLIFLSRGGHLGLLGSFAAEIWVPEPVAGEIRRRGYLDITAQALTATAWLVVQPVPSIPTAITEWRLGIGESATLALASPTGWRPSLTIWPAGNAPRASVWRSGVRWASCSQPSKGA